MIKLWNFLGIFYENGCGVTKNKKKALQWYKKAMEKGNEKAKGKYSYHLKEMKNKDDDDDD